MAFFHGKFVKSINKLVQPTVLIQPIHSRSLRFLKVAVNWSSVLFRIESKFSIRNFHSSILILRHPADYSGLKIHKKCNLPFSQSFLAFYDCIPPSCTLPSRYLFIYLLRKAKALENKSTGSKCKARQKKQSKTHSALAIKILCAATRGTRLVPNCPRNNQALGQKTISYWVNKI